MTALQKAERDFLQAQKDGKMPYVLIYDMGYNAGIKGFPNTYSKNTAKTLIEKLKLVWVPGYRASRAHIGATAYVHPDDFNKF